MASYKTKNAVGPWSAGAIITDEDLKQHPEFGGVARLRDKLGAIEDTNEKPNPEAGSLVEHVGTGKAAADRRAENATGNTKPGASTAADAPNAGGRPAAGKS